MTNLTTPTARASLPSLEGRPDADVVLYDGNCPFCRRQVARLDRWDTGGRLAFLSLHDPRVPDLYPGLSHEQLMTQMYVINRAGYRYGGAAAFRYLTRRLPWLWPLAPLLHVPFSLPVWQLLYRQIAQRRYALPGERCSSGSCHIH